MMNKRGWIKIVEAVIALLIIVGVLLIVINKGYFGESREDKIYNMQVEILRSIELNDELRANILGDDLILPIQSRDTGGNVVSGFPPAVTDKINAQLPTGIDCVAKICELDAVCGFDILAEAMDKEIYSQPVAIAMTKESPEIRQLKLFCWRR